jgi:hypothetical protein
MKSSKLSGKPLVAFDVTSLGADAPTVPEVLARVRTFLSDYRDLSVRRASRLSRGLYRR